MQIAFFPWLYLKEPITLGTLTFLPFRDERGNFPAPLTDLADSLTIILRGYVDMHGEPIDKCVVVTHSGRDPVWNLEDDDHNLVRRCALILALAAISKNAYNTNIGCYANSTTFQFFRQRFTEPVEYIAFGVRRRDGSTTDAGYRHGEIKFTVPPQSKSLRETCIDAEFAVAIERAVAANSPTARRLIPALSFFSLANTDSDVMDQDAEVILFGSGFEQLLNAYNRTNLNRATGNLLQPYASTTVEQALAARPGIVVEPEYAAAQRAWPLHRKWAQELYDLRSTYAHGLDYAARTWGWAPIEHVVMAAFVFPLLVKLLLTSEGYYTLADDDDGMLAAIDKLLGTTRWAQRVPNKNATFWQDVLFDTKHDRALSRVIKEWIEEQKQKEPEVEGKEGG